MDRTSTRFAPAAPTGEPATSVHADRADAFAEPPLVSDCLDAALAHTVAEAFPPGGRKPRHDGFTPDRMAEFLRTLAATGVVERAAAAAGVSASAAYAFRNRRQGRAFAKMWNAVLVHRARDRLSSELQARAIAGCVSVRRRDGEVVGEYHYYDNRLAMALLTRLDRLAEREAPSEAHLRALSEDLDDFAECLASGGDADAFVEARRPREPEPPPPDDFPDLTLLARRSGCADWRDVPPNDIPVEDLDPSRESEWTPEQHIRAWRSGFAVWLQIRESEPHFRANSGTALGYHVAREGRRAAAALGLSRDAQLPTDDLDPDAVWDWSEEQLARAYASGLLAALPDRFWEDHARSRAAAREEGLAQPRPEPGAAEGEGG